jgi:putative membrane protein insertion efficiency factor
MSLAALVLRALVRLYQLCFAGLFPASCRFEPSCSHYAMEALRQHGAMRGTVLTVRRVLRCNPWGGMGYDPVPAPRHEPASADGRTRSSTVLRF